MSISYDPSRASLFHPGRATDFFDHGPLASDEALCAEMARVAYVKRADDLRSFLSRAGFSLLKFGDIDGSQGFVAARGTDAVIAFRGTGPDDPTDLGADADLRLVPWPAGGRVHRGFSRALDAVWPVLEPAIPAGARLLMTGHSLGAALATLAATRRRPDRLVTLGCPRVGDPTFAANVTIATHDRYVDCADIVTRVPPEVLGYAHTGARRYLDRTGREQPAIADAEIEADRLRAEAEYLFTWAFRSGTSPTRGLADHAPINYLSGVAGLRA